jgi:hypothetical protein
LGGDGKDFLIGVSLYNHGNIWGIADPPEDWNCGSCASGAASPEGPVQKKGSWPYNLHSGQSSRAK